jgi:uncharacterized protein
MKKRVIFFSTCLIVVLFGWSLQARAEESQVVVTSSGTVSVKLDMAEFGVVVKSDAKNADKAAAETAVKYRTVQNALRNVGIPPEDASTTGYTISPNWEWEQSTGKNVLKGYSARHAMIVKVHSLGTIGRVIDAVAAAGADEVQNIKFLSSRYDALRQQALAAAVGNARRDGEVMARAAGGRLGQLIEVSFSQPSYQERPYMEAMAVKMSPSPASTEIAPADQDISVNINSRWRFISSPAR